MVDMTHAKKEINWIDEKHFRAKLDSDQQNMDIWGQHISLIAPIWEMLWIQI